MTLHQLECFIAVAEHMSFTKAAESLLIAQSALSHQISRLEKKIGAPLFFRDRRSVRLTPAGEVFLPEAIRIVNSYQEALQKAREAASGITGNLRIGFLSACVKTFLPRLIKKARTEHPGIKIILEEYSHGALTEALRCGKIDLAFTLNLGLDTIPGAKWITIYSFPETVVLPRVHSLAGRREIDLAALAEENFVTVDYRESPHVFERIIQLCARAGFSPTIINQTRFIQSIPLLVETGVGISILPEYFNLYSSCEVAYIRIKEKPTVDIVLAWKASNRNPVIPHFLESTRAELDSDVYMRFREFLEFAG
ncbi:MAG: LysR family transcriptional regulator [Moorellaceae bacterium]